MVNVEKIKALREAQGISQEALASKMGHDRSYVTLKESKRRQYNINDLVFLSSFFDVMIDDLIIKVKA